jgi:hypothetical protein
MTKGHIYIFSNPTMPELYKVGKTQRDTDTRKGELRTTGVAGRFVTELDILVENCHQAELQIHKKLDNYRLEKDREYFRVDLNTIIKVAFKVCPNHIIVEARDDLNAKLISQGVIDDDKRKELILKYREEALAISAKQKRIQEHNEKHNAYIASVKKTESNIATLSADIESTTNKLKEIKRKLEKLGKLPVATKWEERWINTPIVRIGLLSILLNEPFKFFDDLYLFIAVVILISIKLIVKTKFESKRSPILNLIEEYEETKKHTKKREDRRLEFISYLQYLHSDAHEQGISEPLAELSTQSLTIAREQGNFDFNEG